jgi:hypothetical protein
MRIAVVTLTTLLLAGGGLATPTSADPRPELPYVVVPDGVLNAIGCTTHPYSFNFPHIRRYGPGWVATTTVTDPTGNLAATSVVNDGRSPVLRTASFDLCSDPPAPGTYKLRLDVTLDGALIAGPFKLDFTMSPPPASEEPSVDTDTPVVSTIAAASHRRAVTVLKVRAQQSTDGTLDPATRAVVVVQRKTRTGGWTRVRGSRAETNASGVATVRVRLPAKTVKVRAQTLGTRGYGPSTSPPVRVP